MSTLRKNPVFTHAVFQKPGLLGIMRMPSMRKKQGFFFRNLETLDFLALCGHGLHWFRMKNLINFGWQISTISNDKFHWSPHLISKLTTIRWIAHLHPKLDYNETGSMDKVKRNDRSKPQFLYVRFTKQLVSMDECAISWDLMHGNRWNWYIHLKSITQ